MISLYLPGTSLLHRLPAGVKLIGLAAASLMFFPVDSPVVLAAGGCAVLAVYAALGRTALKQLSLLRPLLPLFAVLLALHWLSGSLMGGVIVLLRLLLLVMLANLVTMTTRMDDMLEAISPLFRPLAFFGVSPRRPALAVTLVLRFLPVLLALSAAQREAYQARTGKRSSWRLLAPFALQALAMADHVGEALVARGGADGFGAVERGKRRG
ncbi:energy-coupling factor transporter transmembrane protein EcfT [Pannonibacter sp. P2PFMT1]|uniref:energy-coupling factor transporter transmembrane component T family protein n=1 Tax=Pannonibacter sp. P2PFMT1 TaxID=2003582 RepID=UPI001646CBE9|nr:energy-coupling factor transporter transmembrane protein EcfT [Pannonibacter sp. P2PFMT1]